MRHIWTFILCLIQAWSKCKFLVMNRVRELMPIIGCYWTSSGPLLSIETAVKHVVVLRCWFCYEQLNNLMTLQTLARVIATVARFTREQVNAVVAKEEQRNYGWVGGTVHGLITSATHLSSRWELLMFGVLWLHISLVRSCSVFSALNSYHIHQ